MVTQQGSPCPGTRVGSATARCPLVFEPQCPHPNLCTGDYGTCHVAKLYEEKRYPCCSLLSPQCLTHQRTMVE